MSGKNPNQEELFTEPNQVDKQGPVECLGMTFENDEARRVYFTERLREKLQDPDFRKIEGFPIGNDEDILALSDPPYYTACPNPFLPDILENWQKWRQELRSNFGVIKQVEQPEPFATDVSEGKNDPIYNAHSYHTKVPHKAIMRYILHYTDPGDVIFDGFCGTGMTGVAAQMCGNRNEVESLGYVVDKNGIISEGGKEISHLGLRHAILNDLSPAATFISYNYNSPVNVFAFEKEAKRIFHEVEKEFGWIYETWHPSSNSPQRIKGKINFTIWSDVFACPECGKEMTFWDVAVDYGEGVIKDNWVCPSCGTRLSKQPRKEDKDVIRVGRAWTTRFDPILRKTVRQAKQVPVLINYSVGKKRYEKVPDPSDIELITKLDSIEIPNFNTYDELPEGFNTQQPKDSHGITNVHHFFTSGNLLVISALWNKLSSIKDFHLRSLVSLVITAIQPYASKQRRFRPDKKGGGPLAGTLYISSLITPPNVLLSFERNIEFIKKALVILGDSYQAISTNSASRIIAEDQSIDYIFVDPPFGGNLMYSELNFLWEAWLRVFTNNKPEAIINNIQHKGLPEYQALMEASFCEFYRLLKSGRWMTIEFHNSQNTVWIAIQEALLRAGFIIADVRVLDKQQGTFKQVTSSSAVKQDLIISAYKPNGNLEEHVRLSAVSEESAWEFVRYHLGKLPVVNQVDQALTVNQERQPFLLFDRMIAFHVQRGILVPLSSAEFYAGLSQRFPERDGMFFLPDQVNEYDQARLQAHQVKQLELFISDESSAILWLRQLLEMHPQTYSDLFPKFIREISAWQKNEKALELSEMLTENFLKYEGSGPIPEQIWGWMQRYEELRDEVKGQNRENPTDQLIMLAKDRWFVPDPKNAQQMEKSREGRLLKEFENYKSFPGKKLKVFRLEAVRAGFKKAWQDTHYQTIINVAEKIPEEVLQQDPKLLMWYDQALTRLGR